MATKYEVFTCLKWLGRYIFVQYIIEDQNHETDFGIKQSKLIGYKVKQSCQP